MTIPQALSIGITANKASQKITGSKETSLSRTVISTTLGAGMGAVTSGAFVVVAGAVAAPIALPLTVASAVIAGLCSLFD